MIPFIKYRRVYYIFSGILILASTFSLVLLGLKLGIDFKGGSILQVDFKERPAISTVQEKLKDLNLGEIIIQQSGDKDLILRMKDINEETHQGILKRLTEIKGEMVEKSFESIGPTVGQELTSKTKTFTALVLFAIIFYIAFAFRKASKPIASWQYGIIAALVAFFHDIFIPLGIFSVLGKLYQVPVTIPTVVGLLTILGYSVHDTIVIFDRVRENLLKRRGSSFEETVNDSLNQTLTRSINTSMTCILVLAAIFFFGGESLKYFSLILILGIVFGTYSSIFLAAPILVSWQKWRRKI